MAWATGVGHTQITLRLESSPRVDWRKAARIRSTTVGEDINHIFVDFQGVVASSSLYPVMSEIRLDRGSFLALMVMQFGI